METILQTFLDWDSQILLFINGIHSAIFDDMMQLITSVWIWIPLYASLCYVMLRNFSLKANLVCFVVLALLIAVSDQSSSQFIRPFVRRLRPSNLQNPLSSMVYIVEDYRGGRFGFPSSHAANSWSLVFFIRLLFHRRSYSILMVAWAILVCYSRIYLGVHFLGDILAGALLGFINASLLYFLFRKAFPQPAIAYKNSAALTIHALAPFYVMTATMIAIIGMALWENLQKFT